MKVTWYGAASLLLEAEGKKIVFDPFLHFPEKERKLLIPFRCADAVFITHGHFDHISDIPLIYENLDVKIFGTRTPLHTLRRCGISAENLREVRPGYIRRIGDVSIEAFQSRHCRFDGGIIAKTLTGLDSGSDLIRLAEIGRLNAVFRENGETLFYEVRAEGKRLQIMGSLALEEDAEYPSGADALVLPFQGRSGLDTYAMPFLERLKPRRVLLDHYDDAFPPVSGEVPTETFVRRAEMAFGIPCEAMRTGIGTEI